MVVLGALPRDELQTTLQDCRLMASLPAWWQRALFKTFLLEQSQSMMLVQMNPFGKATSGALILGVALYLIVCTVFVISFHLDQNSQRGVVANQAVYTVALLNLSIDVIFISPIALLLQNVLLPALVARILRRPLSIGMQDIVEGNQVGADKLSAVLSAKRAAKRWLTRMREQRNMVQELVRGSIAFLERTSEDDGLDYPGDDQVNDLDLGAVERSVSSRESYALGFDDSDFDVSSADHFTACNPMTVGPSSSANELSQPNGFDQYDGGADTKHSEGGYTYSEHADVYGNYMSEGYADDGNGSAAVDIGSSDAKHEAYIYSEHAGVYDNYANEDYAGNYGREEYAGNGSAGSAGVDGADGNNGDEGEASLPDGWAMVPGDSNGSPPYYYNTQSGVSQWEYPQ